MSMENLKADLNANLATTKEVLGSPLVTAADVAGHLTNTLWPFLENMVEEMVAIDDSMAELYNESEDILTYDSAVTFATIIAGAKAIIGDYQSSLVAQSKAQGVPVETKKLAAIIEWEKLAQSGLELLEEITLPEDEDEEDEGDDEDEGGESDEPATDDKEKSK